MGLLDWFLMVLPDHVSPKEPQNDEGTARQVISNYRESKKIAQELADAEDQDFDEKAQELQAEIKGQLKLRQVIEHYEALGIATALNAQHDAAAMAAMKKNDQIALEVRTKRAETISKATEEKEASPTMAFDDWLARQGEEPVAPSDLSPAVKDFLINPNLPDPTNDYEPS